jgi:hypothetical protein
VKRAKSDVIAKKNIMAMEILDLYQKETAEWNTIQLLLVPLPPKGRKSDMALDTDLSSATM